MNNRYVIALLALSFLFFKEGKSQDEVFDNGVTLKMTYINNIGNFGEFDNFYKAASPDGISSNLGISKLQLDNPGYGFGIRVGSMFFLNSIDFNDKMRIGIDVTYWGFNYSASTFRIVGTTETTPVHNIYFNPEVGPSFTYAINDDMAIDAALKASFIINMKFANFTHEVGTLEYSDSYFGLGAGVRFAPAVYFRYYPFLVGAQYNMGSVRHTMFTSDWTDASYSSQHNTFNLLLGFKF